MPPTFATLWELSVLHCGRFPQDDTVVENLLIEVEERRLQ
jgi:hypothetical protein